MKTLEPNETDLVGRWVSVGARVEGDDACKRIKWLVSEKLQKVATDASGWDTLYLDPVDGRFWEITHPQSELHGGGPPRLTQLPSERAKAKYGELTPRMVSDET